VVIVTYNAAAFIDECLSSLSDAAKNDIVKVIAVDNASIDSTADIIRENFPWVRLVLSDWNRGFGAGNNMSLEYVEGDYVFFLNPDTAVEAGCCEKLIKFLEAHPDVGCVGPAVVDEHGSRAVSYQAFTNLPASLWSALYLNKIFPLNRTEGRWEIRRRPPAETVVVDRLLGAAMMIRRSIIDQVGSFDERFFLFSDEEDLCYRVSLAGWKICYIPEAVVRHIGGGCTRHNQPLTVAAINWSRYLYMRKHGNIFGAEISRWVWIVGIIIRLILNQLNRGEGRRDQSRGYILSLRSLLCPGYFDKVLRPQSGQTETVSTSA